MYSSGDLTLGHGPVTCTLVYLDDDTIYYGVNLINTFYLELTLNEINCKIYSL